MRLERQAMMDAFDKRLESLLLSQKFPTVGEPNLSTDVVKVSTKGSCSTTAEIGGDIGLVPNVSCTHW